MDYTIFLFSFLLSSILHFTIQKVFIYFNKFDDINFRSSHKKLATTTGGIGVFLTLFVFSVYYYLNKVEIFDYSLFIPLGIMFLVGVYDDIYKAHFKLKFFLQIIVAKILIDQGFVINNYYGLFGLNEIPWILAQLTTVFVFIILVNAINFIDGVDGLAISEVIKIILVFEFFSEKSTPFSITSIILISSLLPLYYFNYKKNHKVFLGDGGSLLLGTFVSIYVFYVLSSDYEFNYGFYINKTLFAVLVLLYPLLDLLRVFIIRIKNKKSPFEPDQNHIHHLILKRFKPFYSVFIIMMLSLMISYFVLLLVTK